MQTSPWWFPLLTLVIGAALAYWAQARQSAKAHERARELRDDQRRAEAEEQNSRERARMGLKVQELILRMEEAHVVHRFLHLEHQNVASGGMPAWWSRSELMDKELENRLEFTRIAAALMPFGGELGKAARKVEMVSSRPPSVDEQNIDIIHAVQEFENVAHKWLMDNTDGPASHLRYG